MRLNALTVCATCLVLAAGPAAADDLADRLPGAWELVSVERDGQPVSKDEVAHTLVMTRLEGDRGACKVLIIKGDAVVAVATIRPTEGAKAEQHNGDTFTRYDVAYSKGRHQGKTLHASIHLDGDTMKGCWTKPDEGGEGASLTIHTFQRVKGSKP